MTTRRWISILIAGALIAACGGGDDETEPADVPAVTDSDDDVAVDDSTTGPDDGAVDDGNEGDGSDEDGETSDDDQVAAPSGSTGRLEIDGESYNLRLGDMVTAMCSVSDSSVIIEDMRASDGSRVAASYTAATDTLTVGFIGPDGNRLWVIGNLDESDGLPFDFLIADNVFSVNGSWAKADDPATTAEGRLVVTC